MYPIIYICFDCKLVKLFYSEHNYLFQGITFNIFCYSFSIFIIHFFTVLAHVIVKSKSEKSLSSSCKAVGKKAVHTSDFFQVILLAFANCHKELHKSEHISKNKVENAEQA